MFAMRSAGVFGQLKCPLAFGLLRLSTDERPDWDSAIAIIHRALDGGIRLLDTADSYCLNDKEMHYGERLASAALQSWSGACDEVRILTKVGMVRPKGKWVPDGRPKHLRAAVEGSLQALSVDCLYLAQLHVKDPRVPFEDTLGTLAELQREGKVEHLGLCNVSPSEVRQAARHFSIAVIQNELSVQARVSATEGMLELTKRMQIPFLAYRPMGGYAKVDKLDKNRALAPLAKRHQRKPHELAIAAILSLGEHVIPLFGARRAESVDSSLSSLNIPWDSTDRDLLETKITFQASDEALKALEPRVIPKDLPQLIPGQGPGDTPEVVLVMGIQGAGKSERVDAYVQAGYARLNRDELGGSLSDLVPELEKLLVSGSKRVVLDNTYPTRISRMSIIDVAHQYHVPVRCVYLKTSPKDARMNVTLRMLKRYGKLLGPSEMKELAKSDPNLPPPVAMQRWIESFEAPQIDEGFAAVDEIPFVRRAQDAFVNKALLLDVDGTLRTTLSGEIYPRHVDDMQLLPGRKEVLQQWIEKGYLLFFVSNQSGIASEHVSEATVRDCFSRTVELLGLPVQEVAFCPHPAFPAGCFCRKPLPGLAVDLMLRHHLSPDEWVMVGDMASDEEFADAIGARYFDAKAFFETAGT